MAAEPALDPARHLRPARAREATGDGAGLVEAARRRRGAMRGRRCGVRGWLRLASGPPATGFEQRRSGYEAEERQRVSGRTRGKVRLNGGCVKE